MRVAVFGAKGRTGRLVVEELMRRGHAIVAASRDGAAVSGAEAAAADPASGRGLEAALAGAEGVVNAMASGKGNPAGSALARALAGREVRYVTVGGAAVDAPGDAKRVPDRLVSWLARTLAPGTVLDRQEELGILQSSRLRWTMLRPPRLVDGAGTGTYRQSLTSPLSTKIARADLARAVADALEDAAGAGQAPFVSA
jgi:putative NADH-flavin reductase